jgi:outer membrane protein OmpA-like peptidoglycan-associated protein
LKAPAETPVTTCGPAHPRFLISDVITPSLQGAIGLTNFTHFGVELGVVIPLTILSGRAYPTDPNVDPSTRDDNDFTITRQGLGDIMIHPKIRFMNAGRNGLGLAVIPSMVLPTGDKKAFLGEGQFIFQPSAVIDGEFGYLGRFRVAINGGARLRGKESRFVDDGVTYTAPRTFAGPMGQSLNTQYGLRVKTEVIGGAGVSFGIVPQKFDLVGEVYGQFGLGAKRIEGVNEVNLPPIVEAVGGIKLYLARNSFFLVGGGWRLAGNTYGAAAPRAFIGFIFEPNIGDRDGDGIKDDVDKCPDEPETYNGFNDDDGCPDRGLSVLHKGRIVVMTPIYFETGKDIIKPESFPVVDSVAAAINGNPWIDLVEIQGHADERGDDAHNLDLTERRAAAVKRALYERGIEPGRLKSHGYGETKPICTQHNEDCWSKNRRVEFIIEKTGSQGGAKFQGGEGQ